MFASTVPALEKVTVPDGTSLAAFLTFEMKAPSGDAATPAPDRKSNDDLDGCDVPVEKATPDEDLPAAEGGVA